MSAGVSKRRLEEKKPIRQMIKRWLPYPLVTAIARLINRPWLEDIHRTERLTEYTWVLRHMQPGWTLDFGSASSYFPEMLAQWGHVDTCDFREWPRIRHPQVQFVGTPPMRGQYDNIVCVSVLEHLPRHTVWPLISDLRRRLAPRGRLLITVPSGHSAKFLGYQTFEPREMELWTPWIEYYKRTAAGWCSATAHETQYIHSTTHQVNALACLTLGSLKDEPPPSLMT